MTNQTLKQTLSPQTLEEWRLNNYWLAGRSCAKQVNEWMMGSRSGSSAILVFEEGDNGAGKLHARLVEDGYQAPDFRPKKDRFTAEGVLVPAFVPLPAADFLAYEVFLEVTRTIQNSDIPPRWPFEQFEQRKLGWIGTYTEDDLQRFQQMVEMTKKIDEWAITAKLLYRDEKGRLCRDVKVRSCTLNSLIGGLVTSDSGKPIIEPVCLQHRSSRILVDQTGEDVTVTCKPVDGGQHQLGTCKANVFLEEQAQATPHLKIQEAQL